MKQRLSTPEHDLFSVSLRPRYLPREFGRANHMAVYAPVFDTPSAKRPVRQLLTPFMNCNSPWLMLPVLSLMLPVLSLMLPVLSADAPCVIG